MKFGLIANDRKEIFWETLPALLKWFRGNGISLTISEKIATHASFNVNENTFPICREETLHHDCDMILAVGGDGTILRTIQKIAEAETPVLGINVGGLGFLTELPLETFTSEFKKILQGEYQVEKRLMIKGCIKGDPAPLYALNEIIIDKGSSVRVIQMEVEVDRFYLNSYIADGLLVSTPTGSTGYSLSAVGPIIVPATEVLMINPICPHSLTIRPVIIPSTVNIKATVRTEHSEVIIAADGRDVRYCKSQTEMTIEKASFTANLVKPLDSNFFKVLHNKLNWGKDFRDKNRWSYDS